MRQPTIDAVLAALAQHSPRDIAAAICARHDIAFVERLIDALTDATTTLATYPHPHVVREADALLYETLRSPRRRRRAGRRTDPRSRAGCRSPRHHRRSGGVAARPDPRQRPGCGPGPGRQRPGSQLDARAAAGDDLHPGAPRPRRGPDPGTGGGARHAHARAALRPGDGTEPFVRAADPSLPPRILSSSPMALVPAWMARMDAHPPAVGLARDRIVYLQGAKAAMGRASAAHGGGPPASGPTPAARHGPDRIAGCEAPRAAASLIPVEAGTRTAPDTGRRHDDST